MPRPLSHSPALPFVLFLTVLLLLSASPATARTNEFRGLWADAWNDNFNTSEKCSQLLDDARSANLNSLIVQVRRRGDAFYNSRYEPKNPQVHPPTFDPLADLLSKAHDTGNGKQKIDIHAWIVTYHVWNRTNPPARPDHPFLLHPDWLMKDINGRTRLEGQYTFDPGHPQVQQYTFNVCMDIVTNYNVDGLHFDYIRYGSTNEGYHDVSVARFNRLFHRTGIPDPNDALWKQFRRDQVTALLRKVYLCAIDARPGVKISASTITWAPAVSSAQDWTNRARPYNEALQDWRSWMEEGILDINVPMNYFRHHQPEFAADYYKWSDFAADHRFNRQAVIGPGLYLNTVSNALHQMRHTRNRTANGNQPDGVCGYVYRNTNNERVRMDVFLDALVNASAHDPVSPPLFAEKAGVPAMPWKTAPTTGHLKGFIAGGLSTNTLDGATISLSGPVRRTLTSDGTGFFGSVDLPPGTYSVSAASPEFGSLETNVTVKPGKVATCDLLLPKAARNRPAD